MTGILESIYIEQKQAVYKIVIVEDDSDDSDFLVDAFKELNPQHSIHCFKNAESLFSYLDTLNGAELPDLIVTDLNIPVTNGITILSLLSKNEKYSSIPKLVYSHSSNPKDQQEAIAAGALLYLKKPNTIADIRENAREMLTYCR